MFIWANSTNSIVNAIHRVVERNNTNELIMTVSAENSLYVIVQLIPVIHLN